MKILLIEDDKQIIEAVTVALELRWPEAQVVYTGLGEKGIELVEREKPDVVILDLGLPDITGFEVLKQIRLFSDVPILILTVRSEETDIVKGLEGGADDYAVKPFRHLELLARIKALTRRGGSHGADATVISGELSLNPATSQFIRGGKEIELTRTEVTILYSLMKNAGQVVTYPQLAEAIWGEDYSSGEDSIKVYIHRLREKLQDDASEPKLIVNKPGVGYFLTKPD